MAKSEPRLLSTIFGDAAGSTPKRGRPVKLTDRSASEPASPTSGTSVTATGVTGTPAVNPMSSTFAELTRELSSDPTVWTESLSGFVENGLPRITEDEWQWLRQHRLPLFTRLTELAEDRAEEPQTTVNEIVTFLYEEEADAVYGSLDDGILFYMQNYEI